MRMRDDEGHEAMLAAGKAWKRIQGSARKMWRDWTQEVGPGLVKARAEAMAIAHTNQPQGKGYSIAMSGLLEEYGFGKTQKERTNGAAARSDLLKCMDCLSEIEAWRAKQDDLSRLNHPTIVWNAFHSWELQQRKLAEDTEEETDEEREEQEERKAREKREAKVTIPLAEYEQLGGTIRELKEKIRELEAEIAKLRIELLIAQGKGNELFSDAEVVEDKPPTGQD